MAHVFIASLARLFFCVSARLGHKWLPGSTCGVAGWGYYAHHVAYPDAAPAGNVRREAPVAAQATHFFAAVLTYTQPELFKLKCGIGHFRLKVQLYTVGLKAMCHQLGQLRA